MSSLNARSSSVGEDESVGDGGGRQTTWRQGSNSIVLEKALKKQKIDKLEVNFEEYTGGSVGKTGKWFNNLIAQIVRDTISPLVTAWEDVTLVEKQLIFDRLDNKFIYPKTSVVKAEVERLAMRTIRDRRCRMRRHWKQLDGLRNKDAPKRKPYKGTEMVHLRSSQLEGESSASTVVNVHQPKDVNIMTQVLGSRSRYVKGLGPLPKLSVVGGPRATNINSKHYDDSGKIMNMEQKIDEQQHTMDEQQKTISEQQKTIGEQQERFDALLQQLQKAIPGFSFQPPSSCSST